MLWTSIKCRAAARGWSERKRCGVAGGTRGAVPDEMSTKAKRSSEDWTIPFHVIMWTTLTVGFIMTLVVLLMRK
jgi:hypothetical protein